MLGYITGSGFYKISGFTEVKISTRFGEASLLRGSIVGRPTVVLPRHGKKHRLLPHHINHRANLLALKEIGCHAVVSCTVCGIVESGWDLGVPLIANDLYFPDNRLGAGETCTVFDQPGSPDRGHLLASSLFNSELSNAIADTLEAGGMTPYRGVYGHVPGPRFNTVPEIRQLAAAEIGFISQTCGPEAVLANELELPYSLAGFGIDYANGITSEPTPVDVLNANLQRGKEVFAQLIEDLREPESGFPFQNFVYRLDSP